jgi:hypothetical protein
MGSALMGEKMTKSGNMGTRPGGSAVNEGNGMQNNSPIIGMGHNPP